MKIAITAAGTTLDAEVDPRFGRCQYFIIADPETMEFEAVDNSSAMAGGGAGISAAQMIAGKGVEAVLTGNCGPNAHQVLSSAGIQVITGVSGKIKDAVEGYRDGKFKTSSQPNVPDHFGMGGGAGGDIGGGAGEAWVEAWAEVWVEAWVTVWAEAWVAVWAEAWVAVWAEVWVEAWAEVWDLA